MAIGSLMGQKIDAFTKLETLTPETAQLFGLSGSAIPDEVLKKIDTINQQILSVAQSKGYVASGSYTGDGDSKNKSLNFTFIPKMLFVVGERGEFFIAPYYSGALPFYLYGNDTGSNALQPKSNTKVTVSGNSITWSALPDTSTFIKMNESGKLYNYVCLG